MAALDKREIAVMHGALDIWTKNAVRSSSGLVERARAGEVKFDFDWTPPPWTAASFLLGYAFRTAEFEALKVPEFGAGQQAEREKTHAKGVDWYTAACSTAHRGVFVMSKDPFEYEAFLEPIGFGHQVHFDWCSGSIPSFESSLPDEARAELSDSNGS
jgi:hypothetical protein